MEVGSLTFCTMAESEAGLRQTELFVESLRRFGGSLSGSRIVVYAAPDVEIDAGKAAASGYEARPMPVVDPQCRFFFFANKVFCAAHAEELLHEEKDDLVWVDDDTLILREPLDLVLPVGLKIATCPVMHNRTGVAWSKKAGSLWDYLDFVFKIDQRDLFPIVAPADEEIIRPYFNAGLVSVDPAQGLFRKWKEQFISLCADAHVLKETTKKPDESIFLHQIILTQVILSSISRDELRVLPREYNYPLFFEELFPAVREFNDLSEAVTARYDIYFQSPNPGWEDRLKGRKEVIDWLVGCLRTVGIPGRTKLSS